MTCLIGFNLGTYAMIAADLMVYHPVFAPEYRSKINRTAFGLIAGAGLSELTDAVAARLARDPARHLADVTEMIVAEVRGFRGPTHLHGVDVREHTSFFITSVDAVSQTVRLHYATPEVGYDFLPVALGRGLPIVPMDAPLGGHLKTGHQWTAENRPPQSGSRDR